ncbi:tyrosine-type recombinase/integrase [Spirillospora sp. CA-142024]|uniref:tyrosine-type recombinase/integrase n=1 Tax=Spirillospora sp. CA-142024 TaxID=3240036 RepID=UPI003D8B0DA0
MTSASIATKATASGLLEKLMGAVRPEFRVDVLTPDQDDPVLGWVACHVAGCDRPCAEYALCRGHGQRWRRRGYPDKEDFIADPGPPLRGRSRLTSCTVTDCHYGASGQGLCAKHRDRWQRAGRPDPVVWAATAAAVADPANQVECRLSFCDLWTEGGHEFCKAHHTRWRQDGFGEIAEFVTDCERFGKAFIDFRGLGPQVKLELQYAVQCRCDAKESSLPWGVANWAIRRARESGVTSLLDREAEEWRQMARARQRRPGWENFRSRNETFIVLARDVVETLRDGSGWETEFPRDVWRLSKLPGLKRSSSRPRMRSSLRFDRIAQPWLKELGKRWVRLRLTSGLYVATVVGDVHALTKFSEFLAAAATDVDALAGIDRSLLERYLAWLTDQPGGVSANEGRVGGLHLFFQAIRQHGWDDTLPTTAVFFTGDFPRRRSGATTRYLAEHVMAQIETSTNLDRWHYPEGRLITMILIRGGLRVSSAASLAFDCLLHDGQGAPYLRYYNTKMERDAAVPIDEELEAEIRAQQRRVLDRWPEGNPNLFPRARMNADGRRPLSPDTYRQWMHRWLATCEVRDEHGRPVHLTPHQWRHTFATRLINRDVPQEVIRVLLDHESTQMTAHYAKITDKTVRRRWEAATKVNIKGERVALDPDGPLAQAQWAKTRYGMATQTLPNGYCGLPVQKSCPHANACLTCPVFITGPEFLPELREQRHRTLTLIEVSAGKGQTRVAEMNQQVLTNLDRMIGEIEPDEQGEDADAG